MRLFHVNWKALLAYGPDRLRFLCGLLFNSFGLDEQHCGDEHKRRTDDQDIERVRESHVCLLVLTVR